VSEIEPPGLPRGVVDIDGELREVAAAEVSAFDRGFLYGDSVFEVLRTYAGRPHRLEEHLQRLERGCRALGIEPPSSVSQLRARAHAAVAAAGGFEQVLRIVVTRGVAAPGPRPVAVRSSVLIYATEFAEPEAELYERGLRLATVHDLRALPAGPAPGVKSGNFLGSILAMQRAGAQGGDEAIVLGPGGEVLEGASSNVFVRLGEQLWTPPRALGILPGITASEVEELAGQLGVPCGERLLWPCDLYGASEIFVTSSVRGLVPAVEVDGRALGAGRPGPLYRRLREAYLRAVGSQHTRLS